MFCFLYQMLDQYEPQVPKFSRCISGQTAQKKVGNLPKINAMGDYKTKFLKFHSVIQVPDEITSDECVHVTAQCVVIGSNIIL